VQVIEWSLGLVQVRPGSESKADVWRPNTFFSYSLVLVLLTGLLFSGLLHVVPGPIKEFLV